MNRVIYAEPRGEDTRDRRMRVEEIEATAYAVIYFTLWRRGETAAAR